MESILVGVALICIICAILKKIWSYEGVRKTIGSIIGWVLIIGVPTVMIFWLGFIPGLIVTGGIVAYCYIIN